MQVKKVCLALKKNLELGNQSDVISLIIQDYMGGIIKSVDRKYYFNYFDDMVFDFYDNDVTNSEEIKRELLLKDNAIKQRYQSLKQKVDNYLNKLRYIELDISKCQLCSSMVEKFSNEDSISYGLKSDILILGEAPANNGWRKSKVAWYDINHKLLPSGKVLQKLLDMINVNIEDTLFLEAIKCFPKDRKYLKRCNENCKNFLFRQIELLNPKVILLLGDSATKAFLNIKYDNYLEVVGKFYNVKIGNNDVLAIPIYHPSPISPKSYNGNIPIFEKLKNEL